MADDGPIAENPTPSLPLSRCPRIGTIDNLAVYSTHDPSSDPLFFSSDDLQAASIENYTQPRLKNQHKRTCYEDFEPPTPKRRRIKSRRGPFKRNFDSACWVESDGSDEERAKPYEQACGEYASSEASGLSLGAEATTYTFEQLKSLALEASEDSFPSTGPVWPFWQPQPQDLTSFHQAQSKAVEKISAGIEDGKEAIDLSDMRLGEIRPITLIPLRHATAVLQDGEHHYQSLQPKLGLNLANNELREVPSEVYRLKSLWFLSLRGNNIDEVLPELGQLRNLRELNVGGNFLRYLPWEILALLEVMPLASLTTRSWDIPLRINLFPNPFIRPFPSPWDPSSQSRCSGDLQRKIESLAIRGRANKEPKETACLVRTPTAFLDIHGHALPESSPAPSCHATHWLPPHTDTKPYRPPESHQTRTPSLLELSLKACYNSRNLSQAPYLLNSTEYPHLESLLKRTFKLREAGGQRCTVCDKEFIVPRTEWIEWWNCAPGEQWLEGDWADGTPVPLIRRGCSWDCWRDPRTVEIRGWCQSGQNPILQEL